MYKNATKTIFDPFLMRSQLEVKKIHEHQKTYVVALVDITVQVIGSIWPNSIQLSTTGNAKPIADLNTFLHHILKHSRTTHSTLQLAIFYLFRIRSEVQKKMKDDVYVSCGRRMFLAALISAHKYLQDKTYKNSAWSKVSGLNVKEINHAEKVMLELLDYRLYVKKDAYDQWIAMLQSHLNIMPVLSSPAASPTPSPMTLPNDHSQPTPKRVSEAIKCLPSPPPDSSDVSTKRKAPELVNETTKKRR